MREYAPPAGSRRQWRRVVHAVARPSASYARGFRRRRRGARQRSPGGRRGAPL